MADDTYGPRCILSYSVAVGVCGYVSLVILGKIVTCCIKIRRGQHINTDMEYGSHMPNAPLLPLTNCALSPEITTVETMPGHALSDMDRDIKPQATNRQELRDLEAAIPQIHQ